MSDMLNGVLNVLKPSGITSHDVVNKIRKISGMKKVGHTGTLDPLATGVLPIVIGKATKLSDYLMDHDKEYRVHVKFGISTSTCDAGGEIIEDINIRDITLEELKLVLEKFKGEIDQIPPMFSAIKIKGKKLYELARQGKSVEVPSRKVLINRIFNIEKVNENEFSFDVECSKGTYIRSLCVDIGKALGVPAYMSMLTRTRVGKFSIEKAYTIEQIKEEIYDKIINIEDIVEYPKAYVKDEALKYILNGRSSYINCLSEFEYKKNEFISLYDTKKNFIGIGEIFDEDNNKVFKVRIFLN